MDEKRKLIKEKVDILNEARRAYEQENREIIPNIEYDRLYDELEALERETGIVLANSPTVNVGYEVLSDLPKERHDTPMLSLDKTKEKEALAEWLGNQKGVLSWKLDGLTIVLTYEGGSLKKAVTRGNGEIGEVITNNAKVFVNLPVKIPYEGKLILRGEAVIKYSDFDKINKTIKDAEAKYKNPRNLCSGTVRQLNNEITAERNVNFCAFALVETSPAVDFKNSREKQLMWLRSQGFETVEYKIVTSENIKQAVAEFAEDVGKTDLPSDGLVLLYDDIAYGTSLGNTAKFPRDSIAFKWRDEKKETVLEKIQWSASRTGQINPIAVFQPVELEGTTVSRASVHNVSILKELKLGIGDEITVYKANMIIPQIAENLTKSGKVKIPQTCPVCGSDTVIKKDKDVEVLHCPNSDCFAKHIKSLTHFVGRNALNIEGISEATIEKFVDLGYIKQLADIFRLEKHKDDIVKLEGFGEKSYKNIIDAVDKARNTTPERLLYALGISNIGVANAKLIAKAAGGSWDKIRDFTEEELVQIDGIGDIMAKNYVDFFAQEENRRKVEEILREIKLQKPDTEGETEILHQKTFVITGSLNQFENRDALKAFIEKNGGKTASAVSGKTDYLINNDFASASSKNKKAKELGVAIITEEQFMKMIEDK